MKKSYIQLIISLIIYSTLGIVRKNIDMSSTHIIFFRALFGSITLLVIILFKKEKINFKRVKVEKNKIFLSGIFMAIGWIALFESYKYLDVSFAVLIHYMSPVFVILLSPIVLKEKLTKSKVIGVILALLGMLFVNGSMGENANLQLGIMYGLLGAAFYAFMILTNKKIIGISGLTVILFQLISATFVIFIYMLVTNQMNIKINTKMDLIYLILLGVVHTAVACYLNFEALQKLSAQTVALLGYLDPLFSIIWANLILGEVFTIGHLIGGLLILSGAIYGQIGDWIFKKKAREKSFKNID